MLISFSVQVPPAATLFLFGFGIDLPCVRRRIKLEVWTSHVSVHNRILLDLLVLMVSLFFVLLNIGAWWTNWWANPSQLAALQWLSDSMCSWLECEPAAYLKHISMENPAAKCSWEKWPEKVRPHHIFHIRDSNVTLSHSWGWYLMPLPSPWNEYDHQIPQIPFVPVQTSDCNNHYGVTNATHQQLLKREDKNLT